MAPIFRYYYVGLVFLAISLITHFVVVYVLLALEKTPGWVNSSLFLLLAYHLPLAIGLSLGLVITWRYWSWLVTEQNG